MAKKIKSHKINKKIIFTFILIPIITVSTILMFFMYSKNTLIESNFNSYLNKELMPFSTSLIKKDNNSSNPQIGIVSKNKVNCSSLLSFKGVVTTCSLNKGDFSILNYNKNKEVYFPIFSFKKVNSRVITPLFSSKIFKKFSILFDVEGISFDKKLLNHYFTRNSDKIQDLLMGDKKEIEDYNISKKNLFSLLEELRISVDIKGEYVTKKRFDIHYILDMYNESGYYKNESKFSIIIPKLEEVSLEFNEGSSAEFGGMNNGSFKTPSIEFISSFDKSFLAFENSKYIEDIVYDFYKVNYYGSINKIYHNIYYLSEETDLLVGKEELLKKISPKLNSLYERVKGNPIGIFTKTIISSIDDNQSGIFIYKKLKKGHRPMSLIVDGIRTHYNYDKYYKEIIKNYALKEEKCSSIEECKKLFKKD